MKKLLIAIVLGLLLILIPATAAFAHTHIELPNGECVNIPGSQNGNAHFGISTAKANENTPFSGGWCDLIP